MKLYCCVLFLFFLTFGYSQEAFDKVNNSYEMFLGRIADKDTLIKNRTKYYKCSEDLSGRIEFYYQEKALILVTHIYKQGFGNDMYVENYFIQKDTLSLKTSISEVIHMNTLYLESDQGISSTSAEKVIEVTEHRILFKNNLTDICFERKHTEKLGEWNQNYFTTLTFVQSTYTEDIDDIRYKYRLLRKAEKKLENYSNEKRGCIFHMW